MLPQKQEFLQKKLSSLKREAEERGAQRQATKLGYPYADLRNFPVKVEALKLIPEPEAKSVGAAALDIKGSQVALAAFNPRDERFRRIIADLEKKGRHSKIFISSLSGLEEAWRLYKFAQTASKEITGSLELEKESLNELMSKLKNFRMVSEEIAGLDFYKTTTSSLLEIILAGALAQSASDIHLEAGEKKSKIRYRLDGLLHDIFDGVPAKNYKALISRIKLLSSLKINIRDEPQDGRFTIKLESKEIEIRVAVAPSNFGETVVMRILDPANISIGLENLGLRRDDLVLAKRELAKPNGLILNTGPTGSGKTTTLYAFLKEIVNPEIKIITIEDPIEYRLSGIEQTQVDPEAGYAFANGLKSIMRQDPDVILVGEIRDLETADIALQASLTGHLVFSTLHTNDAVGAVPRLLDLGVKPIHIGPAINLIIAQRLVRKLCDKCKEPASVNAELSKKIKTFLAGLPSKVDAAVYHGVKLYQAKGCEECNDAGYRGRIGIFEFLETGREFEEFILQESSAAAIKRLAEKDKMVTMQKDGILKAISGITDFEEVERVTGPIEWK